MSSTQPSYDPQWAAGPPGLSCALCAEGPGVARVNLSGELDLATAPQLQHALTEAAAGRTALILDLSELTFMDSTGLHLILSARARLAEADCRLVLVPGDHQVQQIFELTGVDRLLEFVSDPVA
jgi:anti-sigma B factor antagonist